MVYECKKNINYKDLFMKNLVVILTMVVGILSFNACKSSKEVAKTNNNSVQNEKGITEKHWKLIELNGNPVTLGIGQSEPYIILKDGEEHRFIGNGSCNNISGMYELGEHNRIKFSRGISTLMACPNMEIESGLLKALESADNYTLSADGKLSLNRARMAPLARFEEVHPK